MTVKSEEGDASSQVDRRVQHGWAIYEHWVRWHPAVARAHRGLHADDEQKWLEGLGMTAEAHKLKLLLDRLEEELEQVREILRRQADFAAANQRFIEAFRAELEFMRELPRGAMDPMSFSLAELERFLRALRKLAEETENGARRLFG
jgi:hypothetical protein